MLNQDVNVEIKHIYREANMAADWLSEYGHSITGGFLTTECFNTKIQNIINDDVIECTLVRRDA